ncbi:MAG TPA: endonuclease/exonuclease/phosphatase family protein [Polyangiaceae bacterium]
MSDVRTLQVATLNIWNRFGPWEQRLAAIRAGVRELAPDIMGMQEVLRLAPGEGDALDQATTIAEGFGYHVAYGRSKDERWYGNAVLSRWPIAHSECFELPRCGTDEKRSLLLAAIDSPFGEIPFFVTHLNWKFDEGHVREAQVLEVARRVLAFTDPGPRRAGRFPAILVGDFNAEPRSDEIRYMGGLTSLGSTTRVYFQDAFAAAGGDAPGYTFSQRNPFAAPLREPDRRIDYIFVRGRDDRFRGEPLEARVCFDAPVDGTYPSDHFGVVAKLRAE